MIFLDDVLTPEELADANAEMRDTANDSNPRVSAPVTCKTCGGRLETSEMWPEAGYLHSDDVNDTHTPEV